LLGERPHDQQQTYHTWWHKYTHVERDGCRSYDCALMSGERIRLGREAHSHRSCSSCFVLTGLVRTKCLALCGLFKPCARTTLYALVHTKWFTDTRTHAHTYTGAHTHRHCCRCCCLCIPTPLSLHQRDVAQSTPHTQQQQQQQQLSTSTCIRLQQCTARSLSSHA